MIEPFLISEQQLEESLLAYRVRHYVETFAQIWRQCEEGHPELGVKIGFWQKKNRERHFNHFLQKAAALSKERDRFLTHPELQEEIFIQVYQFLVKAVGMKNEHLDLLMSENFKNSTKEFVAMARKFDASLSPADMFQACRNVWIMNGLQLLLGQKIEFTQAIGAYSLLYPYTDNYLDDIAISHVDKTSFNERFTDRLRGGTVLPTNSHEKNIFALVEIIEMQFNPALFPHVFESLVAIQKAQAKSVSLIHQHESISARDILNISLEKGGASVLADGYLIAGNLTEKQERFLFGYGAYLQFLDDLQDVREDAEIGQKTIYSMLADDIYLDDIMNQTFLFGDKIIDLYPAGNNPAAEAYVTIIKDCVRLMLIEAACLTNEHFSKPYLMMMEKHSPIRFKVLRDLQKRHEPYYMSMFGKVV